MNYYALGNIYNTILVSELFNKNNSNVQKENIIELKEHQAPVTSIEFHHTLSKKPDDDLNFTLISCGIDSNIKLWNHKISDTPILNIECPDEFLTDIKWNPIYSGMFVTSNIKGNL